MKEYSLTEAAERAGKDRSNFRRVALRIGAGRQVGRLWIYTAADVRAVLAAWRDGPGNPEGFDAANGLKRKRRK